MKNNIIIIGFMGTGKTEAGKRLSQLLGFGYLDTDELIEKTENKSITEIFAQNGEEYFRNAESRVLGTLSEYQNLVISTGGGIVLREENVKKLKALGTIVLLTTDPEEIINRLKSDNSRPLLQDKNRRERIDEILEKRNPIYEAAADVEIDTTSISADEVARQIIKEVKNYAKN
jgi:shikimate kinase